MTRNEKLLQGLDLQTATGIEIGALDKPIIPRKSPHVFYVDHALTPALKAKYQDDPNVDVDHLVQVGGVWGEASLAQAAAAVTPVDFIVASHVIEHVPDLITWLQELASVLKPQGQVRLAIPDKRYTFDLLRSESIAADVLAAHLVRARRPQPREILDYLTHIADIDPWKVWDGSQNAKSAVRQSSIKNAMVVARDSLDNGNYHDVHCWVFTPLSFALLMHELVIAGYVPFACAGHYATERNTNEFLVTLQLSSDSAIAAASWLALTEAVQAEQNVLTPQLCDALAQTPINARPVLEAALNDNQAQIEAMKQKIEHMHATTSWRVTAPLRALGEWLRQAK